MRKKALKLSDVLFFGKYRGKSIGDIMHNDVQYIHWAIGEKIVKLRPIAHIAYKIAYARWEKRTRAIRKLIFLAQHSEVAEDMQAQAFHEDCGDR
jgi:hypothetical protein